MGHGYNHHDDCTCNWCMSTGGPGSGSTVRDLGAGYDLLRAPWPHCGDGLTRPTRCPTCGADVFFIRHNGGSVWLDELGPPWPKHPCFESDVPRSLSPYRSGGAVGHYLFPTPPAFLGSLKRPRIGVVARGVRFDDRWRLLEVLTEVADEIRYCLATGLLWQTEVSGALCVLDAEGEDVWVPCAGRMVAAKPLRADTWFWDECRPDTIIEPGRLLRCPKIGLAWCRKVERTDRGPQIHVNAGPEARVFLLGYAPIFVLTRNTIARPKALIGPKAPRPHLPEPPLHRMRRYRDP